MTSPRRSKKSGTQCVIQNLDWDSPSAATGTVKRRRSSCPEHSANQTIQINEAIFEVQTPSDSISSGSGTSRSTEKSDRSDSLVEVEQRISFIINENRSSNSESSDVDIIIDNILDTPFNNQLSDDQNVTALGDKIRSNTFIKETLDLKTSCDKTSIEIAQNKNNKDIKFKTPVSLNSLNKSFDIVKNNPKLDRNSKLNEKSSVLPIYKSTVKGTQITLTKNNQKKSVTSKLKFPFSPTKTMEKPKTNIFQSKNSVPGNKPSPLLSSPVRRTISNEYVRLKFTNDTVVRRTIDGKSVPKITPKIQSIIPESPIDNEDPFLNLSPNKKYTVTTNNKVRCDKDNYVIFDPTTGFNQAEIQKLSKIPSKTSIGEKSKIPLKSPGESSGSVRKSANASDTDSGILSPNSPVDASEKGTYYVNAAAFSETARKYSSELDITILDPVLAKKATEQVQVSEVLLEY